jgi:hypothetical protein
MDDDNKGNVSVGFDDNAVVNDRSHVGKRVSHLMFSECQVPDLLQGNLPAHVQLAVGQ